MTAAGGEARNGAGLEAEALRYSVSGQAILNGVTLALAPRERLAVIGPNGSGKSTLLRCLYGWWKPTGGVVRLDGEQLESLSHAARARRIAVLAQESEGGLGLTVEEVVALGRLPHRSGLAGASPRDLEAVETAVRTLELEHLRQRPFSHLSGGEKQRALFARALAQEPALLILDEPTNHLDIRHQLEILDLAHNLGVTVISTLHDINLAARWADRLCLMQDGRVRALGDAETVLDPALLTEVYGVLAERDRDPRSGSLRLSFHRADAP